MKTRYISVRGAVSPEGAQPKLLAALVVPGLVFEGCSFVSLDCIEVLTFIAYDWEKEQAESAAIGTARKLVVVKTGIGALGFFILSNDKNGRPYEFKNMIKQASGRE